MSAAHALLALCSPGNVSATSSGGASARSTRNRWSMSPPPMLWMRQSLDGAMPYVTGRQDACSRNAAHSGSSAHSASSPSAGIEPASSTKGSRYASRLGYTSGWSHSSRVTHAACGRVCTNFGRRSHGAVVYSSPSNTNGPVPSLALPPTSSEVEPRRNPGSKPARSSMCTSSADVVVLPCVPHTARRIRSVASAT